MLLYSIKFKNKKKKNSFCSKIFLIIFSSYLKKKCHKFINFVTFLLLKDQIIIIIVIIKIHDLIFYSLNA